MHSQHAYERFNGKAAKTTGYVIAGEGDAWGYEIFNRYDDALARIVQITSADWDSDIGIERTKYGKGHLQFDPEDDRITIWEVLPTGHRRAVWHFSGWHWESREYKNSDGSVMEQGALPGHSKSLFEEIMDDY